MKAFDVHPLILRVLSGLKSRLWDPIARLFHTTFPKAWLLEGAEKESGLPVKLLLFGDSIAFNYIALTVFHSLPHYQSLGRTAFWRWQSCMHRHSADLFYAETTMFFAQLLARRRGFCQPEYVDAMVPTDPKHFSRSSGQIWLHTRKAIQEKGWTMRVSQETGDFYRFYNDYYFPTAMRKFGGHRYIMPLGEMSVLFRMGFLLHVCDGDRILGSILAVDRKRDLWLGFYGGLEESPGTSMEGIQSASYYFGLQYGREHGRAEVNFGSVRPYFQDGVFQHKRRWKARFQYTPQIGRCYWFVPNLATNGVRRYLNRCPFIAKNAQGLEGIFFYDPLHIDRSSWASICRKNYVSRGMESLRFIPLGLLEKPQAEHILVPAKPTKVWPELSRAVLKSVESVRSEGKNSEYQRYYAETPHMPLEQLKEMQRKKLTAMLLHAQETVPHFQSLLKGFRPSQFSWEWYRTLPILDRSEIALKPDRYRTLDRRLDETKISTSGTTAHPLMIWVDRQSIDKREIVRWRGRQWWGLQRGDRFAHVWGREKNIRFRRRLVERWLENAVPFDGFHFTPGVSERCRVALSRGTFKYVYGFASVIAEMASDWLDRNQPLPIGCVEAVIITADMISDVQKQMIWRAFGCPIISEYGSTEFHEIAFQCPDGGWHMDIDRLYIEFINENGRPARAHEPAHLVISDLDNTAMPLLRYPLGDIGSFSEEQCHCGRTLPLMHELLGRTSAFLELPHGGRASSLAISSLIEDAYIECGQPCLPWQVVQTGVDQIEVILTNKVKSASLERAIGRQVRSLDLDLKIHYRYVDALPCTPSGKRTRLVSLPNAAKVPDRAGVL